MTGIMLTHKERLACWREAGRMLELIDFQPPTTESQIDTILQRLPKRLPEEVLDAWLQRARTSKQQKGAVIIPFPNPRYVPLTEFLRRAASSDSERYPLPDNGYLESVDGRFRLKILKTEDTLRIIIEALGMAADEFANTYIGLSAGNSLEDVMATAFLDADGDGECVVPDTEEIRRILLKPMIGAIQRA